MLTNLQREFCIVESARVFHAAGARLVLCGRDAARLQQVVQELTASSANTQKLVCIYTQRSNTIKSGLSEL